MKHYADGKDAFENKPIDIKYSGNIKTSEISVSKQANYYNFQDEESVMNDFLDNVGSIFKASSHVIMKCSFSLKHLKLVPVEDTGSITILNID